MKDIFLSFFLTLLSTFCYSQKIEPLFKGTPHLHEPYGMCAHFTFSGDRWDEGTLKEQTIMLNELGANIVRCDVYGDIVNNNNTAILDRTLTELYKNKLDFLAIAYDFRLTPKDNLWHSDNNDYNRLLKTISTSYIKKFQYVEFHNEVNFSGLSRLGYHYTDDLKQLYSLKKRNKNLKILFSGISDSNFDFLDSVMKYQSYKYFDIMNFHTYRSPEDIPAVMEVIHNNMIKYHWNKSVWITECGMNTAKVRLDDTNYGFFNGVVPQALKRLGMKMKGLNIGVINDVAKSYYTLNDTEVKTYINEKGANCKYLTFDDLKNINPDKVPVIVLTDGESFYCDYFPSVLNYVKNGGTIILPYGTPFYYDASKGNKGIGKYYANQLHVGQLYWWDAEAKKNGVPQYPTFNRPNERFGTKYTYDFKNDGLHSARYLTDKLLKGKDKFTPICYAGNDKYTGVVAALYQLNSDLKGNVIIQTRVGVSSLSDLEDEQARRVARIHLISFAYGIDKVFWYKFRSYEKDPYYSEDNFGMLHADLSPKPAYYAYKTLIKMLPNGSTRPVLTIKDGIYKAEWRTSSNKEVVAYWCKTGHTYINVVDNKRYKYIDYIGKELKPIDNMILVTNGVIYQIKL